MQAQLTRQLRADKRAEAERVERESRRQARRDHEMRELAIKLRRKQREMRHQQNRRSSEEDSDGSRSRSSSRDSREPTEKKREPSRSKSRSPPLPPACETDREPSTSYRSKTEVDTYQNKRRYQENVETYKDDRKYDDRPPGSQKYDKHQRREYGRPYDRQEYNESRWENDSQNWRKPYGHRGGLKAHSKQSQVQNCSPMRNDYDDEHSPDPNRNKIKLVDY